MISLRALKAFKQRQDVFEIDGSYFPSCDEIVMRRRRSIWRKHADWLAGHRWQARLVIVLCELAIAYGVFVAGMLAGVAVHLIVASWRLNG